MAAAIDDDHHIAVMDLNAGKGGGAGGAKGGKPAAPAPKGGKGKSDGPSGAPIVSSAGIIIKGGREIIRDLDWTSETDFTSVGVKHCVFWTLSGGALKGKKASPIPS